MTDTPITQAELARRVERAKFHIQSLELRPNKPAENLMRLFEVFADAFAEPAPAPHNDINCPPAGDMTLDEMHGDKPARDPMTEIEVGDKCDSEGGCFWKQLAVAIESSEVGHVYDVIWFGGGLNKCRKDCTLSTKRPDQPGDAFRLLAPHEDYKTGAIVIAKRIGHIHNAVLVVTEHDFYIPRAVLVRIALAPEAKPCT